MAVFNNILAGASGQAGGAAGYEIERSLRFNSADSAYLSRTPASAGNRKTWTFSVWVKLGKESATGSFRPNLLSANGFQAEFWPNNTFRISGPSGDWFNSLQVFRDFSAWFHLVITCDTTLATADDRIKVYVNGSRISNNPSGSIFQSYVPPSQNYDTAINNSVYHTLGAYYNNTSTFEGYLADAHMVDGQALDPTSFGEFDATTGVWNPIAYTGSYGTNGFHLPFSDNSSASALGTDDSGNGNDWTVNNISVLSADPFDQGGYSVSGTGYSQYKYITFTNNSGQYTFSHLATNSNTNWFFSDTSHSYQLTHSTQQDGGNTSGYRNNGGSYNNALSAWGTFATANSVTAGHPGASGGITGLTGLNTTNATNYWTFVVDTTNNKVWIDPGTGSYVGGGDPSNTSSTPTLYLPSGVNIRFWSAPYTSTNLLAGDPAEIDSLRDSPTNGDTADDTGAGGEVPGNYCTMNPLNKGASIVLSNGNLTVSDQTSTPTRTGVSGTIAVTSGKWYFEGTAGSSTGIFGIGVAGVTANKNDVLVNPGQHYMNNGDRVSNGSEVIGYGSSYTTGDVIGVAYDADSGTVNWYKNNVAQGSVSFTPGVAVSPWVADTSGTNSGTLFDVNFGQRQWAYSAPSGYKALCTANLDDPTIADGSTAMDVALYTGNGTTQTISGLGFSPDFVWTKRRSGAVDHFLFDVVRGSSNGNFYELRSSATDAEGVPGTPSVGLTSLTSDGFTLGSDSSVNANTESFAAWCWDGGSSTVSNTDGSITSSVRANPTAGFSVISANWSSTGGTIGHGLGVAPQFIIAKNRDNASNWPVWHTALGAGNGMILDDTNASYANNYLASTLPTSSVITVNSFGSTSSSDYIVYAFAPVAGYSAFGSFVTNGTTDNSFVFTGFRPRFIIYKRSDSTGAWGLRDTARDTENPDTLFLQAQDSAAEGTGNDLDVLSNGFKIRSSNFASNATYIYYAVAENPFKYARAR